MAFENVRLLVIGEGYVAVLALGCPVADFTAPKWCVTSSVLKKNDLLFIVECSAHFFDQ
jgi:hypothetical protein